MASSEPVGVHPFKDDKVSIDEGNPVVELTVAGAEIKRELLQIQPTILLTSTC